MKGGNKEQKAKDLNELRIFGMGAVESEREEHVSHRAIDSACQVLLYLYIGRYAKLKLTDYVYVLMSLMLLLLAKDVCQKELAREVR